jgi:2-dehydro-3-deoxyphosphogluconate aldolase/(4S)-4-hydroxy-2-oxoglutarate aldolase
MTKEEIRARIVEIGIIPAIRVYSESEALFAGEAVCSSGIPIVEVTMTIPGAVRIIGELMRHRTDIIVGAGTVFDVETAARCLDAGAGFLTSPGLDLEVVEFAKKRDTLVLPGAMTPSEIMAAWKAGADFVKVFPCAQLGGPDYMRVLKAPFPRIPLIAAGGVNQKNAADYVLAGATALGIGQHLIHENAIKRRQRERIHELARRYINMVSDARRERTI